MPADRRFRVHDLLRLRNVDELHWEEAPPDWSSTALHRAPWVVVRRTRARSALLPVGIRGDVRLQRAAAWLPIHAVEQIVTPQILARQSTWRGRPRTKLLPALWVLDAAAAILEEQGYGDRGGPGGSVGFELASGEPSVSAQSDLDLVLDAPEPIEGRHAARPFSAPEKQPAGADAL